MPTAMRPVPHGPGIPIPKPPEKLKDISFDSEEEDDDPDDDFNAAGSNDPRLFSQSELYDLKPQSCATPNGNKYASIPVGHSVRYKECYENLAIILKKLKYKDHMWTICWDLKVISMLLGLQGEIQNIHASCVSGTVGKGVNTGLRESGQ
ncbi:hypothetical protein AVEN_117798-1 [Araneus ventricosus]|uniref:Uncharacterized protein n=1 Tax=Araneus ventricosus TaxID=182803 RepID=A0A4Y2BAS5_ARAVE|nr:hypothetical protein AVEN_117798-1 [Araneus ventricosus]